MGIRCRPRPEGWPIWSYELCKRVYGLGGYDKALSLDQLLSVLGIQIEEKADQTYRWNKDGWDNEQIWQNQNIKGFGGLNTRPKTNWNLTGKKSGI